MLPQPRLGNFRARLKFDMTEPAAGWRRGRCDCRCLSPPACGLRATARRSPPRPSRRCRSMRRTARHGSGHRWPVPIPRWKSSPRSRGPNCCSRSAQRAGSAANDRRPARVAAVLASGQHDSRPRGLSLSHQRYGRHRGAAAARIGRRSRSPGGRPIGEGVGTASGPAAHRVVAFEADGPVAHTLELRYRRPAATGLVASQEFTPPQLVGSSTLSEVYWQFVLPGDRHVVQTPASLVPLDTISGWRLSPADSRR